MPMLEDVKRALRVTHTQLDGEIQDLIDAAQVKLILSGVSTTKAQVDDDALIKRAIITYCKAEFIADADEAARFLRSFESLAIHLSLAADYNTAEEGGT